MLVPRYSKKQVKQNKSSTALNCFKILGHLLHNDTLKMIVFFKLTDERFRILVLFFDICKTKLSNYIMMLNWKLQFADAVFNRNGTANSYSIRNCNHLNCSTPNIMHLLLGTDKPDFVTQKNINHEWHDWNVVLSEWYHICGVGRHGRDRMVVGLATAYVSSVTKGVGWNPAHRGMHSTQHYVIKFISVLRQVGCFLRVLRLPPPIELITTI